MTTGHAEISARSRPSVMNLTPAIYFAVPIIACSLSHTGYIRSHQHLEKLERKRNPWQQKCGKSPPTKIVIVPLWGARHSIIMRLFIILKVVPGSQAALREICSFKTQPFVV